MTTEKILRKHAKTYASWKAALEGTDGDAFSRDPGDGTWALGRICDHVLEAARVFLDQSEALTRGTGTERGAGMFAAIMLTIGSMPPGRFKVPDLPPALARLGAPQAMTKDEALQGFVALDARMQALAPAVAAAPKRLRSKHPVAGWFNAPGWMQLSEMHTRHHLRQLKRIQALLDG